MVARRHGIMGAMAARGRKTGGGDGGGGSGEQQMKVVPGKKGKSAGTAKVGRDAREEPGREEQSSAAATLVAEPSVPPATPVNVAQVDLESPARPAEAPRARAAGAGVKGPVVPATTAGHGGGNGKPVLDLPATDLKSPP